jgi:crotonobetainyl-CoA:carnitine CoA-transferase CaiB-like acyl-CoA transferase
MSAYPSSPCSGLRVIEFATMVSGPFCGQVLADLGAEVIKIEPPGGDSLRMVAPHYRGMSSLFMEYNRGKKSIAIDLKSPEGVALARQLAGTADVVIENFRPGVMKRLGLGYENLREVNKQLVFVSITGFGDSGPYVERPAYDQVIQGLTGYMSTQGRGEKPEPIRNTVVDKVCGHTAAQAVLAALLYRERGGEGQYISVPLLDAYAAFILAGTMSDYIFRAPDAPRKTPRDIFQLVQARDGYVIGHIQTRTQFEGCCHVFGREDLLHDPRFETTTTLIANVAVLWAEMGVNAGKHTVQELVNAAATYNVPLGPVNDVEQFIADPQAVHNVTFVEHDATEFGPVRQIAFPARFELSPARANACAPKLGEHTDEMLRRLGLTQERIEALHLARTVYA